jgi:hypothetical protein
MEIAALAHHLVLGDLLETLRTEDVGFDILDHWQQGEFHHDLVLQVGGSVLLVATNCNGGVKEILRLAEIPHRGGLWHSRCPDNPEFEGPAPQILDRVTTAHWFDPCELLVEDARSELKPEHRERQAGGGWVCRTPKA